ncbi:histidinol-phosphate transaminase [Methanonatronarchaeum sp. AMET-Sl]|uniref:pyridoxal phosphate-dependent aminotransferase n=1 Tax=Methanonatronarchaeum sp. AMET-Sl TaxID=3037654 RepID=UPI00244E550E|nr:histidinol-phosphate transaminase [Methanonatronarchaeum sp. AMET-Sl]WGI16670.1 histidinol-phosphate transaminase [Methanonatronarchaeum sp. AMET-Sl]
MFKPKKYIIEVETPHHGGMKEKEIKKHGLKPSEVIDFSASLNPYGPPKVLMEEIWKTKKEDIQYYPESDSLQLKKKISTKNNLKPENVIVTAGMSELIDLVAQTYVKEGTSVVIPEHTYGEYEPSSKLNGAEIKKVEMPEYKIEVEKIKEKIDKNSIIYLCNPNNPTGDLLTLQEIKQIMDKTNKTNSLLIIDEAYHDFLENPPNHKELIDRNNDIIIMRTYTKAYNIPGIRVGYGLSNKKHINYLMKTKIPWNIGNIPQRVIKTLNSQKASKFMKKTRKKLIKNKKHLKKQIESMGLETTNSQANFITINIGNASKQRKKLLKHGLIVRDCSSFGMPQHIRIAVRKKTENQKLIEALKKTT